MYTCANGVYQASPWGGKGLGTRLTHVHHLGKVVVTKQQQQDLSCVAKQQTTRQCLKERWENDFSTLLHTWHCEVAALGHCEHGEQWV